MKKIGLVISIFTLSILFTNCEKEENENNDKDLLIGKWKLSGLVNISDEQKYLNTILKFSVDKTYSNIEESGENIVTGTWDYLENIDYIQLSSGIFGDYLIDYRLKKNDSDFLILERHYTLDDKDVFLEYHYERIN